MCTHNTYIYTIYKCVCVSVCTYFFPRNDRFQLRLTEIYCSFLLGQILKAQGNKFQKENKTKGKAIFFFNLLLFPYLHGSSNHSNVAPFAATLRHGGQTLPNIQKMFATFPYAREVPSPRSGTRTWRARCRRSRRRKSLWDTWPAFRHRSLTSATRRVKKNMLSWTRRRTCPRSHLGSTSRHH